MGKLETVADFIFGGSKITADGDCSHEIKRCLLLGRRVMTNLDSILKSVYWIYMYSPSPSPLPPPSPLDPSGSSQCTRPEHLSHASNLDWRSVSHLIIYMFRCCSLETSHPRLLPQSPKVCSVHLCLFFCFAYRVIITFFLNSIYMCVSML